MSRLISKKELLQLTGISYGQLYRWKRKKIIPEEWFIKKSSFTGQETYFPQEKVLMRIERIKELKDDLSLDDIAQMFSPKRADIIVSYADICDSNMLRSETVETYKQIFPHEQSLNFQSLLSLQIFDHLMQTGEVSLDEGKQMISFVKEANLAGANLKLLLLRKFGVGIWMIRLSDDKVRIDSSTRIVVQIDLQEMIDKVQVNG